MRDGKSTRRIVCGAAWLALVTLLAGGAFADGWPIGDMNGDGLINGFDIDYFVFALNGTDYGHVEPGSHYPFDGNPRNYGYSGNHGTVFGGVSFQSQGCGENMVACFDGGHIEAPDHDSLDLTGSFTIEMWLYRSDAETHKLVAKHEHGTNSDGSWQLEVTSDGRLLFQAFPGDTVSIYSDTAVVPLAVWTHIAFTYDGEPLDQYAYYVDGDPAGSGTADLVGKISNTDRPVWIGALEGDSAPSPLMGNIDELRIWDRCLTEAQIDANRAGSCRYAFGYPSTIVCDPITVGTEPYGVAIMPDGSYAYVTNLASGTVSQLEMCTKIGDPISSLNGPTGITITPDGEYAYISNH